ncbi:MAG: uracil phosphoribosyltransferase, partial [Bacteroidales bacterium]|nr:uracil phosphoribosyltransferase [Bacteroidales bacterium]
MKTINLSESNSVLNNFIAEIRDSAIQKDPMRFRRNMERVGEVFAYEISKTLNYTAKEVNTPLGIATCNVVDDSLLLATLLRAGLPIHNGILNVFDRAQNCFISTYRKYGKDNKCTLQLKHSSIPDPTSKVVILADAMLASGASLALAYQSILEVGTPSYVHIVAPIASAEGVEYLSRTLPHSKTTLWVAAIDEELTNKSLIIPGLGDAG